MNDDIGMILTQAIKAFNEDGSPPKQREYTTRSGVKRSDNSAFSNALDDYGILANLQRFIANMQDKPHSDGVHGLVPGISHPGVTPNAAFLGIDLDRDRAKKNQMEIDAANEEFKQKRIEELYNRLEKTPTKVPSKGDIEHTNAMEGKDTSITYMQPGEKVMPVAVQKQFPELAIAVEEAIGSMGKNPQQFVVGSDKGNYNTKTGVQQFDWMDDLYKTVGDYGKTAADYVANNPYAKAAATGALVAGGQYLGGASGQTSLASGLGAGLGSYGGQYLDQALTSKDFGSLPKTGTINSKDLSSSLGNLYDTTSKSEFYGASLGAGLGGMVGYKPNADDVPNPSANIDTSNMSLANVPMSTAPTVGFLEGNDNPNYLARPSAELPIAPMFRMPSGVSYKQKVKDKDTGAFKYSDIDEDDQGGFMRNLSSSARRSGFGNSILV